MDIGLHFNQRAAKYNTSSNWVKDKLLIEKMFDLAEPTKESAVLDVATGTGKIAEVFSGKVNKLIGIDISQPMIDKGKILYNELVISSAEEMPFYDNTFDVIVCRQGLQFMDLDKVIPEIYRVLKPGGRTVLCHLVAYSDEDKKEAFNIQKLRNPARKNFFMPNTIPDVLQKYNFKDVVNYDYISKESVNQWIYHGAIGQHNINQIKEAYQNGSENFKNIHKVKFLKDDITDDMLFGITRGTKKQYEEV
ncbi:MAG: hypothetical protein RHS_1223 [Robinsoniella sp. RHS]|uniref:class I SAM-dependent methyltransferase n=1 Tax=Robinsoniella sp. RHS TaxID=1504536 RepID=UPI00064A8E19|nr:MAG: hypothetical protein RHS_1223 [Robinsoniella sp. RHS]